MYELFGTFTATFEVLLATELSHGAVRSYGITQPYILEDVSANTNQFEVDYLLNAHLVTGCYYHCVQTRDAANSVTVVLATLRNLKCHSGTKFAVIETTNIIKKI